MRKSKDAYDSSRHAADELDRIANEFEAWAGRKLTPKELADLSENIAFMASQRTGSGVEF